MGDLTKKALIAMSGGVDSSVAAALMAEQGYDCIGITMKLYENETIGMEREGACCSLSDTEDARKVCGRLGMPYYVLNFKEDFAANVIDRFVAAYEAGELILANRYTTSNAVHQASKLERAEREAFLSWLFDLEYRRLELPEPDLVVYLDLPVELTERLLRARRERTHTQADIHEQDEAYLRSCRENAREIARDLGWRRIDCSRNGDLRTPEDIHREVWELVRPLTERQ